MEPFHQLSLRSKQIRDVRALLEREGFNVTESEGSWLGAKFPEFTGLIVAREGCRVVFATTERRFEVVETILVYPNEPRNTLIREIRARLEANGATFDFFIEELWLGRPTKTS